MVQSEEHDQFEELVKPSFDEVDGWKTGNREPPSDKEKVREYMRCDVVGFNDSCCCNDTSKCTKCWCCFDQVYECGLNCNCLFLKKQDFGRNRLPRSSKFNKAAVIYDWLRWCNCWPVPYISILLICIEVSFYAYFKVSVKLYL